MGLREGSLGAEGGGGGGGSGAGGGVVSSSSCVAFFCAVVRTSQYLWVGWKVSRR